MLWRSERESAQNAATLTTAPMTPTTITIEPSTSCGEPSRWMPSIAMTPGEQEQRRAVDLRRQDLGAPEAERERARRGPRGEARRDEREPDRGGVGEHVRGVGEQRERAGQQARDDLDAHEAGDERQRDGQPAAVGVARTGRGVWPAWPWSWPCAVASCRDVVVRGAHGSMLRAATRRQPVAAANAKRRSGAPLRPRQTS